MTTVDKTITSAKESIGRLKSWSNHVVLPFWAETGFDRDSGSFYERLDFSGNPLPSFPQRTLVQGRQIYVFSQAAQLGWLPEGAELAIHAAETMIRRHWCSDGNPGWIFSITADGVVADNTRDSYSHAFALYGLAWAFGLHQDPRYLAIADQTFEFLDTFLASKKYGGVLCNNRDSGPTKRQNPHMHLFEAALAWYEVSGKDRFIARANEIFGLFSGKFFQKQTSILAETFHEDWVPFAGVEGRIFEPGHHFEWVWLLHRYARTTGQTVDDRANALFTKAMEFGQRGELFVDGVRDDGVITDAGTRIWPQTEALKAFSVEHITGRRAMTGQVVDLINALEKRFIGKPFSAGWIDHFDSNGVAKVDFVPASTLYHIILALVETDRVFNGRSKSSKPTL